MNPLQQAEQLKHLSDQQLQQERGRMPEYLLVAELGRRDQMRKAYQADVDKQKGPRPTVSEEMWAKIQPPPQMMMQQPQQMQQAMPPGPPQQAMSVGGLVQRLAQGGMVRYADGGQAPAMTREDLIAMAGQRPDIAQYVQQARGMVGDQDNLSPIMAELAALKAKQIVSKPSVWQSLMQMGAGMMSSRNPTPLGGLGEGMQQAIQGYGQQRDAYNSDQARMQQQAIQNLQQRAAIAQQQNQRQMGIADLAGRLKGDASHEWNTTASVLNNNRLAAANQAGDLQRTQMNIDAMAPVRAAQEAENLAQAQNRQRQETLFQAYLAKAKGDPVLAKQMMVRDDHPVVPRQYSPLEMLQQQVISQAIRSGEKPDEIMERVVQMKSRAGITEERYNQAVQKELSLLLKANEMNPRMFSDAQNFIAELSTVAEANVNKRFGRAQPAGQAQQQFDKSDPLDIKKLLKSK